MKLAANKYQGAVSIWASSKAVTANTHYDRSYMVSKNVALF